MTGRPGRLVCLDRASPPRWSGETPRRSTPRRPTTSSTTSRCTTIRAARSIRRTWQCCVTRYRENIYVPGRPRLARQPRAQRRRPVARRRQPESERSSGCAIDFNRYTTGQRFLGLTSLVLDNLWQDTSLMRESLAMAVYRRMGDGGAARVVRQALHQQ